MFNTSLENGNIQSKLDLERNILKDLIGTTSQIFPSVLLALYSFIALWGGQYFDFIFFIFLAFYLFIYLKIFF